MISARLAVNKFRLMTVPLAKKMLRIGNMSLFLRKRRYKIEKLFYRKTYTAADIVATMRKMGMNPGGTVMIHCAMNNFYNYRGTAEGLIQAILEYLGPNGTLCMPAYPFGNRDSEKIFDVRNDKTAAGYLAETFRKWPGVKRSLSHEHSVCALGPLSNYLLSDHEKSRIRYDEHSPFFKLATVGGLSFNLGMPKHFIGTIEHVPEALLYGRVRFFTDKFSVVKTFKYLDYDGQLKTQEMLSDSNEKGAYIRKRNSKLVEQYFNRVKYGKTRLSNIWIIMYDANYAIERLKELALEGKTVYGKIKV